MKRLSAAADSRATRTAAIIGVTGAAIAIGIATFLGLRKRRDGVMEPTYTIPVQPDKLTALEKTMLEQYLLRMAMTKAPLTAAEMTNAFQLAIKGELPKTAATLKSIITDKMIGGPTYVSLPTNEGWPGTNVGVRTYVTQQLAKLQTESTKG